MVLLHVSPGLRPRPSLSAAGKFPGRRRRGIVSRQPASTRTSQFTSIGRRHKLNRAKSRPSSEEALRMKLCAAGVILPGGILGVGSSVGAHASLSALGVSLDAMLRLWHPRCERVRGLLAGSSARHAGRRVRALTTATPTVRDWPCRRPDYAVLCRGSCTGAATGGGARSSLPAVAGCSNDSGRSSCESAGQVHRADGVRPGVTPRHSGAPGVRSRRL